MSGRGVSSLFTQRIPLAVAFGNAGTCHRCEGTVAAGSQLVTLADNLLTCVACGEELAPEVVESLEKTIHAAAKRTKR